MVIEVKKDGSVEWHIYKKSYRKSRWRKVGNRELKYFMNFRKDHPGAHGLIIVK